MICHLDKSDGRENHKRPFKVWYTPRAIGEVDTARSTRPSTRNAEGTLDSGFLVKSIDPIIEQQQPKPSTLYVVEK